MTRQIRATVAASPALVIGKSTGSSSRCRFASVTEQATVFFPTSTATTTIDDAQS